MGYTVFHDAALEAAAPSAEPWPAEPPAAAADPAAVPLDVAPAARPATPSAEEASSTRSPPPEPVRPRRAPPAQDTGAASASAAPVSGSTRRPSVRLPDRLQIALLRASGCNPSDPATKALMESWPLDALRGNPAAKRALWPQLRALRRRKPSP